MNKYRICSGFRAMRNKKVLMIIPFMYVGIILYLWFRFRSVIINKNDLLIWRILIPLGFIITIAITIIGIVGILYLFSRPFLARKIEHKLCEIGFTDFYGDAPILLERRKEKKGYIYEFFSPRIPLREYEKHKDDIQTILNNKIIDLKYGKDVQNIIIRAVSGKNTQQDILPWKDDYLSDIDFELVLGESDFGVETQNLNDSCHWLCGGATNSGKTNLFKLILLQCIKKNAKVYIADFKGVDFPSMWHKVCSIITEPEELDKTLDIILHQLDERKKLFVEFEASNISEYNEKVDSKLNRIIIAIDEVAEVLDKTGLDKQQKAFICQIESKLSTILRMGRAFGIHCIMATQRPSADILPGQIRSNLTFRVAGYSDKILSQIILDNTDAAEKITPEDKGMFLTNTNVLFKSYYVTDECLEKIAENMKEEIKNE